MRHKLVPFVAHGEGFFTQVRAVHPSRSAEPREAGTWLRKPPGLCAGGTGRAKAGQDKHRLLLRVGLSFPSPLLHDQLILYRYPLSPCGAGWWQPPAQPHPSTGTAPPAKCRWARCIQQLLSACLSIHSAPPARTDGQSKPPFSYPGWGIAVPQLTNRAMTNK